MLSTLVVVLTFAVRAGEPLSDLPELYKIPGPYIKLPCQTDSLEEVERFQLYVSEDCGKKWAIHHEIGSDEKHFVYLARKPGEYWFTVRLKMKDGTLVPGKVADFFPMQRVQVATGADARVAKQGSGPQPEGEPLELAEK